MFSQRVMRSMKKIQQGTESDLAKVEDIFLERMAKSVLLEEMTFDWRGAQSRTPMGK